MSHAQVDLAVQKGHSDEIMLLEFSPTGKYLASLGANNEVIIWGMSHEKSLSSFTIPEIEEIVGMRFSLDEENLNVTTKRTTYSYNIISSDISESALNRDTTLREKTFFYDEKDNYEVQIIDGAIRKKRRDKRIKKYKLSTNYFNSPFTSFDLSIKQDLIIGVAEDERIYCFTYFAGIKKKILGGHNSRVNDVRFTADGNYFATAGKDRSIIIWDANTLKITTRLSSNVYRKKTALFSHSGNQIYVGDELGYIYEINLEAAFPQIRVQQSNFHSVNQIVKATRGDEKGYYVASSNNHIYYHTDLFSDKPSAKYIFRDHPILEAKKLLLQNVFGVYQSPYGHAKKIAISPNNERILYTGNTDIPNITFANVEKNRVKHLYNEGTFNQWTDVCFTSDSTFIGIQDSSSILYQWKTEKRKFFKKTDELPMVIKNFEYLGNDELWLNTAHYGQYVYNLKTRVLKEKLQLSANDIFHFENYIMLAASSNSIVIFDLDKDEKIGTFHGHKDRVTDINFHPDKNLFISSSDDGTCKLWNLEQRKLIVTLIPFRNEEFVFITKDNNYLITKGAMHEIGFKHDGHYFYPEQFDLMFNRPHKVLEVMGFSDSSLIEAYHKAYTKRLKKMNFTEEQLSSEFHLPEAEIVNELDIPSETDKGSINLKLRFHDDKFNLDRINIWVNDVAIYGVNGISLREKKAKNYEEDVLVNLAYGRNKIEVSALNQTGAESYKKTVEIISSAGKKVPDLYIISVGVSKHKNSQYDLEFAEKDAKDIVKTFETNSYFKNVYSKVITNEEVTLENIAEAKPFLTQADINDVVLVFVAGHGVLDDNFDYFFASHDMNFSNPSLRGIPYSAIENLLDGIKALKKLLFIDTCHSGELDKDEIEEEENLEEEGELIFRSVGNLVKYKDTPLGLKNTNELMKSLFTDLRKGTGATVISSSGGTELAIEGGEFKNGLFTYCLIDGLITQKADLNKDKSITISELQMYIRVKVKEVSRGRQTPTSRIQNNELDYRVW